MSKKGLSRFWRVAPLVCCLIFLGEYREGMAAPHEEAQTTPLLNAALRGDIVAMKALIKRGAKVTEESAYGNTPLHYTLHRMSTERRKGRIDAVTFLVNQGANVNAKTRNGTTPLMEASDIGDTEAVDYLLSHGAIVDLKNTNGETALQFAASRLYGDILEVLLAHGAKVNDTRNDAGQTPLIAAIAAVSENTGTIHMPNHSIDEGQRRLIVSLLLQHKADVNASDDSKWTAVALAADRGYADICAELIRYGADVNVTVPGMGNETPLMMAARRNSMPTVKALMAAKPDLSKKDSSGRTALSYASGNRNREMSQLLLNAGADR